jgi:hypothetical protein
MRRMTPLSSRRASRAITSSGAMPICFGELVIRPGDQRQAALGGDDQRRSMSSTARAGRRS